MAGGLQSSGGGFPKALSTASSFPRAAKSRGRAGDGQAVGSEPIDSSAAEAPWESWDSGVQEQGPALPLVLVLPRGLAPAGGSVLGSTGWGGLCWERGQGMQQGYCSQG